MEAVIEKECSALGGLFQTIISDMKGSYPAWEDFINKAGKLQSQLRTTVVAAAAFLDAFQKVADMATNTRGGTREIGSALTRMCMRHRSIESKLRQFSSALIDCLINPLQEQMEEWKKVANQLDKDHAKEYKKARQEIKKKSSDTLKLQKKAKKGRGDIQPQLDSALQDVNDKYLLLEETEKQAVRKALIEERGRFCTFVSMLRPVIEEEISMLGEITHLQTISDDLKSLTMDPHKLPSSSEQVILDLKGSDYSWSYQTPPSSPSTTMSRKSSVCSSLNSVNSSDSRSSGSHSHSPSSHYRYRSSNLPQQAPMRLSSVSSHDSGFMSQDAFQSKSPSPMPPEAPNQNSSSSASSEASETCQSVSECSSPTSVSSGSTMGAWASTEKLYNGFYHCSLPSDPSVASFGAGSFPHYLPASRAWSRASSALHPDYVHYYTIGPGMLPSSKIPSWKDWAKPGPYDQPMANTLQRRKEKREPDPNGGAQSGPLLPVEEAQRPRSMTVSTAARQGEEMEACEELALALTRGLQLDTQRSSRDSLQCSSGYSTQTTTPCCSEDTIPSQELAVSKEGLSRIPFPLHQQNCGLSLDQLHLGKSVKVSDYDYFSVSGDQEAEQQEFDKSSTIPRNSDISQSYRRMFQAKRPASTAGLPTTLGPVIVTPGVATIRRTPSTKPSVRRGTIGAGPIPIKTPVIPVKTPTVPDVPGGLPGTLAGAEESAEQSPESPLADGGQGAMPSSWSGQASVNPPPPSQKLSTTDEQRQAVPESEGEESEKESSSMLAPPCQPQSDLGDMSPGDAPQGEDMLNAIRRGVKLKKTTTNDRSAPRIS
ncbi:PREDICTED: metastasis suppressor protein 1 isoform X2 [Gavialis gangeticus]|uniref:metastasis suppressor protein 1 isoform X2 n=1 Tax=Gavialis gangeticus TaxID=94835 RepID=UPI00092F940C|nr:PREDICTED: metastasis suppressor protein 1 isoform X2 [Gavialis gangeticus]